MQASWLSAAGEDQAGCDLQGISLLLQQCPDVACAEGLLLAASLLLSRRHIIVVSPASLYSSWPEFPSWNSTYYNTYQRCQFLSQLVQKVREGTGSGVKCRVCTICMGRTIFRPHYQLQTGLSQRSSLLFLSVIPDEPDGL